MKGWGGFFTTTTAEIWDRSRTGRELIRNIHMLLTFIIILSFLAMMPTSVNATERVIAQGRNDSSVTGRIEQSRLKNVVTYLEGLGNRVTWQQQWKTARWAAAQLEGYGLEVKVRNYEFENRQWPNVIARLRGKMHPDEIIMLIAHIDSTSDNAYYDAPGADDDGSGVAALLEIARNLQHARLNKTVMICLFSNEERGARGSKYFAQYAREQAMGISAVINLDVLGFNAPAVVSPWNAIQAHETLKHKLKAIYRIALNLTRSLWHGKNRLAVGGQEQSGALVAKVSQVIRENSDLTVASRVGKGCG